MTHPTCGMIRMLVLSLLLISLAGCAPASTQPEPSASPASPNAASPQAGTEAKAPAAYPPAPSDASGMRDWFEQAYPEAQWLARIKNIEYVEGEVPSSGGFANAIVITTDLDFATEQAMAQEIATALGEAHPAWAKQFVVWFADGDNLQAGEIFDATP